MNKSSSRKKLPNWKVGDRICAPNRQGLIENAKYTSIKPYLVRWDNGNTEIYSKKDIEKFGYQIDSSIKESLADTGTQLSLTLDIEGSSPIVVQKTESTTIFPRGNWEVGEAKHDIQEIKHLERECKLEPADSSRVLADSVKRHDESAVLIGSYQSKSTTTQSQFYETTLTTTSGTEISEISSQDQANMTLLLADSRAMVPVGQESGKGFTTKSLHYSESFSDASASQDPSLCSWSNLEVLNIEDFERGLEDCLWRDIQASIQSWSGLISLERSTKETGYLSCPTLLSSAGLTSRPAGTTECEKWWKENVILRSGYQLNSAAMALLQGFPANWFRSLTSPHQPEPQADSKVEFSQVAQLHLPKQLLPSNGLNGYGENFPRGWQVGNRIQLNDPLGKREAYQTGLITELHTATIKIVWDKKCPGCNDWTILVQDTDLIQLLPCDKEQDQAHDPLGKSESVSRQAGSLYQYTSNKADKFGLIQTYPKVEGERKREENSHWYWGFSYAQKELGKWRDKSASVPRKKLAAVRQALRDRKPYTYILHEILGK